MRSEKWLKINGKSLEGKLVAVTGTTGGLGRELCRYIAALGGSLLLLDRDQIRSATFERELRAEFPSLSVERIHLQLEVKDSVRRATEELKGRALYAFVHNAGAYAVPRHTCSTGYDNVFSINFLSPYYMIRELLPTLRKNGGRVVAVGSIAHRYSATDPADVDFSTRKKASLVYGNAKRYLMFSLFELFCREEDVRLSVVHPGITFTNITAHYPKLIFAVIKHPMKIIFMKPHRAVLSILAGFFDESGYLEWIGPRHFDVWGLPKKKTLRSVGKEERERIFSTAERLYDELFR